MTKRSITIGIPLLAVALLAAGCISSTARVVDFDLRRSAGGWTLHSVEVQNVSENRRIWDVRVQVVDRHTSSHVYTDSSGNREVQQDTSYRSVMIVDCEGVALEPGQAARFDLEPPRSFAADDPDLYVYSFSEEEILPAAPGG